MHIPDGLLNIPTQVGTSAVTVGALYYSLRRTGQSLQDRQIPLLGVTAAFVFAAQLINFPVFGGTSGHLIGGTLSAVILGPWAAVITMSTVIVIQALLFQDGGITALGANLLNMAVITPLIGYYLHRAGAAVSGRKWWRTAALFVASMVSVMASAAAASVELALSGTIPLKVVLLPMLGWHVLIGAGEGIITTIILGYLLQVRSDLVQGGVK